MLTTSCHRHSRNERSKRSKCVSMRRRATAMRQADVPRVLHNAPGRCDSRTPRHRTPYDSMSEGAKRHNRGCKTRQTTMMMTWRGRGQYLRVPTRNFATRSGGILSSFPPPDHANFMTSAIVMAARRRLTVSFCPLSPAVRAFSHGYTGTNTWHIFAPTLSGHSA